MAGLRFAVVRLATLCVVVLGFAGCVGGGVPPVSDRSRVNNTTAHAADYRVVAGDTLYSIAWRHQRDFRELAALNSIRSPYDIFPGQRLRVRGETRRPPVKLPLPTPKAESKTAPKPGSRPAAPHPLASTQPKPQRGSSKANAGTEAGAKAPPPASRAARSTARAPAVKRTNSTRAVTTNGPVKLNWPTEGKRILGFGQARAGSPLPSNSIDFLLPPGASIRAAAAGEVVYVGRALAGFEQFVIVKHNDTWLSAYGFNAAATVREKQQLASGSVLAVMGPNVRAPQRELHFEVRKNGAPVNPAGVIN